MILRPLANTVLDGQPEEVLRRLVLWDEARGEPAIGMAAVHWVVQNRCALRGKTPRQIILAPWQFSGFNKNNPARERLVRADIRDFEAWLRADTIVRLWDEGVLRDPTSGATHYYNPSVASPEWGRGHPDWQEHCVIGNHVFGVTK